MAFIPVGTFIPVGARLLRPVGHSPMDLGSRGSKAAGGRKPPTVRSGRGAAAVAAVESGSTRKGGKQKKKGNAVATDAASLAAAAAPKGDCLTQKKKGGAVAAEAASLAAAAAPKGGGFRRLSDAGGGEEDGKDFVRLTPRDRPSGLMPPPPSAKRGITPPPQVGGLLPPPNSPRIRLDGREIRFRDITLVSELGRGEFGTVCECALHGQKDGLAMKLVETEEDAAVEEAKAELRLMERLRDVSDFVVRGRGGGCTASSQVVIFMDYMPGGSLLQRIRRGDERCTAPRPAAARHFPYRCRRLPMPQPTSGGWTS